MSKTFDEGGAKGLLLANLGVGTKGCSIVFDSKLEEAEEEVIAKDPAAEEEEKESEDWSKHHDEFVNVSSLTSKLESLLAGLTVHSLPLVPQLSALRDEFAQLEREGFVEHLERVRIAVIIVWVLRWCLSRVISSCFGSLSFKSFSQGAMPVRKKRKRMPIAPFTKKPWRGVACHKETLAEDLSIPTARIARLEDTHPMIMEVATMMMMMMIMATWE
jgi:hypothetical protein